MTDTHDNGREEQWTLTKYDKDWWQFENETEEIAFGVAGGTEQQRQRYLDYLNELEEARALAGLAQRYREALRQLDGLEPSQFFDMDEMANEAHRIASRALTAPTPAPEAQAGS